MKKFVFILTFIFSFIFVNAQDSLQISYRQDSLQYNRHYYEQYVLDYSENYFEIGAGALIPTDGSNTFSMIDLELGRYINKYLGIGLNFKYGEESQYYDNLGYIGPNIRYKINYTPINDFDLDIHAGFGYGWLMYEEYFYDYDNYYNYSTYYNKTISYVVPNIGLSGYINLGRTFSLGIEPAYYWYISTNKEESTNVGVWNILCKLKFRF